MYQCSHCDPRRCVFGKAQGFVDKAWSIGADRLFCPAAAFFGRAGLIWINVARGRRMAQN
jgi:hypothetical protein